MFDSASFDRRMYNHKVFYAKVLSAIPLLWRIAFDRLSVIERFYSTVWEGFASVSKPVLRKISLGVLFGPTKSVSVTVTLKTLLYCSDVVKKKVVLKAMALLIQVGLTLQRVSTILKVIQSVLLFVPTMAEVTLLDALIRGIAKLKGALQGRVRRR